jgi:hypothetical protein
VFVDLDWCRALEMKHRDKVTCYCEFVTHFAMCLCIGPDRKTRFFHDRNQDPDMLYDTFVYKS